MKDKRGQFYIISAVIIVLIVISLASVATYTVVTSEPRSIKDLSNELRAESPNIVAHGIYNQVSIPQLLDTYTGAQFVEYFKLSPSLAESTIAFVYGNRTKLFLVTYTPTNSGGICTGSSCDPMNEPLVNKEEIHVMANDTFVTVNILGKDYQFQLREGEMFYFIISSENNGETYVESNSGSPQGMQTGNSGGLNMQGAVSNGSNNGGGENGSNP